jgi:hypothetical protein
MSRNSHWYRVTLSPQDLADGKQLSLVDQFAELYQRMGSPVDVALFCSQLNGGSLDVYVTPATEKQSLGEMFIRVSGAKSCPRPQETLILSVGHDEIRDRVRAGTV